MSWMNEDMNRELFFRRQNGDGGSLGLSRSGGERLFRKMGEKVSFRCQDNISAKSTRVEWPRTLLLVPFDSNSFSLIMAF